MVSSRNSFKMLVKPIRRLIEQKGFKEPTAPQERIIPRILEGKNVLLISPTATGKTEAAVLPILDMFIRIPERSPGIKILYITPLKALNRDLLERLEWLCNNLDVKLAVRHGDTETRERSRQARNPPDMLITTPETLQAIIPGRVMRRHLQQVRWVVIDEVHEMADSKRGSQLSLALERLRWIKSGEFQIIGLSATIGSPETVGNFLVGNGRKVEIVKVSVARLMRLKVLFPEPNSQDVDLASKLFTHPEVAARLRIIRHFISKQKSVLLFTNTRSVSEVLASRLKIWDIDFPVSIHHGSLAKPSRLAAEQDLKSGKIKGLVCTSSLELGIDIGQIDMVIQYMSPRQVARLIQRVGRSGHRIGRMAIGLIITMDSDDTLEAMVIAGKAYREEMELVDVLPKPYDVLAHQIAGLLINKRRWSIYEILDLFKKAYPYVDLSLKDIQKVLTYMYTRYPRLAWVSIKDMLALKPGNSKGLYEYYFENLSMIPHRKHYIVVNDTSDVAVGVLDEAFMAEYGKPGVKFIIQGSPWIIVNIHGDKVYVKPVDDPTGSIPSWIGEEIPVPFEVAQEVGWLRGYVENQMNSHVKVEDIIVTLSKKYPAEEETIARAILETVDQIRLGFPVSTNNCILVEEWKDFVIVHANFGSLTNRALAQLIGSLLSDQTGYTVAVQHDPYRIFIQTAGVTNAEMITALFDDLKKATDSGVQDLLTKATVKTGLFKRRLIHVARRFGAIREWVDFSNVSLRKLIKSFEDTAIFEEALKEAFTKDLDLRNTLRVFKEVRKGKISIKKVETKGVLTPIARVGVEKVSMKTDLIPSDRMRLIIVESAKARLFNETNTFVCIRCWDYVDMLRTKDLPNKPTCPKCGSSTLGLINKDEDKVFSLAEKKGQKLTRMERKQFRQAQMTGQLMSKYGKAAAVALSSRRLGLSDVKSILSEEQEIKNRFFELVIDAERKALKRKNW